MHAKRRITSNSLLCLSLGSILLGATAAEASITFTIGRHTTGAASIRVTTDGNTFNTTTGAWDTSSGGELKDLIGIGGIVEGPFNALLDLGTSEDYLSNEVTVSSPIAITVGSQTLFLDRFSFDHDTGDNEDDFSFAFGDGSVGTIWDTTGAGVGAMSVGNENFQLLYYGGSTIDFDSNFNEGIFNNPSDRDTLYWSGINVIVDSSVGEVASVPEPSSLSVLALGAALTLSRRRRNEKG